jgi:hypothetical protein
MRAEEFPVLGTYQAMTGEDIEDFMYAIVQLFV